MSPRRPAGQHFAGVDQPQRRLVVDRLGGHRPHQRHVIDDPSQVRNELADHHSRLAMRLELERRSQKVPRLLVKVDLERAGIGLAVVLGERGLGVEQVHLAGTAVLEQADDRFGPRSAIGPGLQLAERGLSRCTAPPARDFSCSSR